LPRKHLFIVVVLLGAALVAGILAVGRTVVLGQPARASTGSDPAITFRMKKLDRLEASLERHAGDLTTATHASPITVYRRAPSSQSAASASGHDHATEHDNQDSDD
jgi:hypothetical protein